MNSMKIKSYTFKKDSLNNKDASMTNQYINKKQTMDLNSNVLSDVEKILKTPGLNLSLSNNLNSAIPGPYNNNFNTLHPENKINIKLNINSEVINNNIRINQNSNSGGKTQISKTGKNSGAMTPSSSLERNTVNIYKEIIKEKDKVIEKLKADLQNAKMMLSKLKGTSPNSFEKSETECGLSLKKHMHSNGSHGNMNATVSNFKDKMNTNQTERKNMFNLELDKKLMLTSKDYSLEIFSDRTKNTSNSLMKTLSSGIKEPMFIPGSLGNYTTLFRQNNKINYANVMMNHTLASPQKKVKPIEDILKSTIKLIDNKKMKKDKVSTNNKSNDNNRQSAEGLHDTLKSLKARAHRVLNLYSEFAFANANKKESKFGYSNNYLGSVSHS